MTFFFALAVLIFADRAIAWQYLVIANISVVVQSEDAASSLKSYYSDYGFIKWPRTAALFTSAIFAQLIDTFEENAFAIGLFLISSFVWALLSILNARSASKVFEDQRTT